MKVYKFWPAATGMLNLQQKRLKLSRISELNDPFEFAGIELKDRAVRSAFNKWRQEQDDTIAIFSFCLSHYNALMWAHYADDHKGICLEFEVKQTLLHEVNYIPSKSTEIQTLDDWKNKSQLPNFFEEISTKKFSHWSYEKEKRLFRPIVDCVKDNDLIFMPINEDCRLTKVYLGVRFEKSKITELFDCMKPYDVQVKKKRPAFRDFRIVERRDWKAPF